MKREKGKTTKPGVRSVIESFNYGGVKLKDSMWKDQFDTMMEYYLNIPSDDILKGFRQRTGRSAPGKNLGGWYTGNASFLLFCPNAKKPTGVFNTFGQWLGAFARMYKVSDDSMVLEKLLFLLNEWGRAIGKDGYFFYGADPNALHYEFEKTVGGLVDIYEYTDEKESGALGRNMKNPTAWILPVSGQPSLFQTKQTKRRFKPYYTFGEEEKYYMYHNIEE